MRQQCLHGESLQLYQSIISSIYIVILSVLGIIDTRQIKKAGRLTHAAVTRASLSQKIF
jgi:hypothetical protein